MDIKEILRQLKKEKNPLKYLQELLKKINDKELKNQIEKLVEELKKENKKEPARAKIPSLENIAQSVSIPRQRLPTETIQLENYQSRSRARIQVAAQASAPAQEAARQQGYNDNYGSNIKSDYIRTKADFSSKLETSGLTSRTGFTTTAESKEAIRRQAGDRKEYMEAGDNLNVNQYSEMESFREHKESREVMSFDMRQARKGKRGVERQYAR